MSKEALEKIVNKLVEWMNQAEGFVGGQVPDVIQQLLRWKLAEALLWLALGLLLVAVSLRYWKRAWAGTLEHDAPIIAGPMIGTALGLVLTIQNATDALQIWIAPKVYLIEFLRGWLKS